MNPYYPHLGSPLQIAGVTLKNRMLAAPISTPWIAPDESLTRENMAFYGLRAKGGAACVTISEGMVHSETGKSHPQHVRLDDRRTLPSLTEAAAEIHRHGCLASIELSHGGKYAHSHGPRYGEDQHYGPVEEDWPDGTHIHAMPEELILEIAEGFGRAAALVKEAGFDMVLVHAGHGWLLCQFMSPDTNTRTDRWGGSFENRMRFPLLCIQKIREAVGPRFPIEFRMSGAEYTPNGYDLAYGIRIAQAVDGKVDLIHVSAGRHDTTATHPTMFLEHGCNVPLAAEIKKHVRTPVATVGGLSDPAMMEQIIAEGKADVVEMARQLLADPFFPEKALTGREADITRCCRCLSCFGAYLTTRTQICALNPVIGHEREHKNAFAPTAPKKVLVAGGGPGGMAAALQAAARGHQVILFEKEARLGGKLLYEEYIPFKADLYRYAVLQARRIAAEPRIEVRLNTPLTAPLAEAERADMILCAVGSEPIVPPLPGLQGSRLVVGLEALHTPLPQVGQRVVILGGGLIGAESAIYLSGLGRDVTVVEMRGAFAPDAPWMHKQGIEICFQQNEVKVHLNTRAKAVTEDGLLCEDSQGRELLLPADTILVAAGMRPNAAAVEALRYAAPRFLPLGDCVRVGKVHDAVSGGYYGAIDV